MRSKARLKSHPLHPMLIPFPIAFLTGAVVFDFFVLFGASEAFASAAGILNIAGVITGLVAAVPGLIDYIYTVPPDSSAKKRAFGHMIVNSTALLLFVLAWAFRTGPLWEATTATLVLGVLGLALLMMGGWMGGTLVYRNQIGIDHRYADAGKWREAQLEGEEGSWIKVARKSELSPGQMKLLRVNGERIVIANGDQGFCAFEDHCTHKGGSLAGGTLVEGVVSCPWHGSQFDIKTGRVRCGPAEDRIKTFTLRTSGDSVELYIPAENGHGEYRSEGLRPSM